MAKKSKDVTRVSIISNGVHRSLFAMYESKNNGDVRLVLNRSNINRDLGRLGDQAGSAEHGRVIKGEGYSIHRSLKSETVNTFKLTVDYPDANSFTAVTSTRSIKANNSFTPLVAVRTGKLNGPDFNLNPQGRHISLGNYHPSIFTLFFSIIVGPPGKPFSTPPNSSFQVLSIQLTHFGIHVIHSYLSCNSHSTSMITRFTAPMFAGGSANEVLTNFVFASREMGRYELVETLKNIPDMSALLWIAQGAVFFAEPSNRTAEWQAWFNPALDEAKRRGLIT